MDLTKFQGALPYTSELFGIYQPLLGWKSKRTKQVHHTEKQRLVSSAIQNLIKATPSRAELVRRPRPIGPDDLVPGDLPGWLRTQGAHQFRSQLALFVQQT